MMTGIPKLDREKPVKMQIYEWLKDQIVAGRMAPGSMIEKNDLARELGVSPTPLREALILLKHDSFIDIVPNLHTMVKLIEIDKVRENVFIRSALEGAVVEQLATMGISRTVKNACQRLINNQHQHFEKKDYDAAFQCDLHLHKTLCDVLEFDSLWENLYANRAHIDRARHCSPINIPGISRAIEQHQALLDLIVAGDGAGSRTLIRDHVYSVFNDLVHIDPKLLSTESGLQKFSVYRPGEKKP